MSVLIKGMKMPKDKPIRIVLNPNGQLFVDHGVHFTEYEAAELHPHGRLIDADKVKEHMDYICDAGGWLEPVTKAVREYVKKNIDAEKTIIEAEGEK